MDAYLPCRVQGAGRGERRRGGVEEQAPPNLRPLQDDSKSAVKEQTPLFGTEVPWQTLRSRVFTDRG